jgi:probable F420-dependent oxidoreductase
VETAAGQGARVKIDAGIGADLASIARRTGAAEAAGLDCVWAAETVNDPFLSLAIAAEHSERVSIGTAVAIAFARNPMSLAYTANQLQEFSQGRMILGLGSQVRSHIERRFSAEWSRPAARMREFVLAMRAVWASWNDGARLDFNGDFYTHTLMTPVFAPRPNPFGAPRVFLAAVGPLMTEVAGEVADGVITHGVSSPRYLREVTLPALGRGLAKSGRTRADVEVTCPGFIAVVDTEEQLPKARAGMRRHLSYYASTPAYRPVLELHGWGDLQTELYASSKRGDWEAMADLVDDAVLDALTIIATPETVAKEIGTRYGGLADRITVSWWRKPWGPAVNDVLRTL